MSCVFVSAYGKNRANSTFQIFNDNINKKGISPSNIIKLFNSVLNYESRLQVIHFLFGIANADGRIDVSEVKKIFQISHISKINNGQCKTIFINKEGPINKILKLPKLIFEIYK